MSTLLLGWATFLATASAPGPSTLAITATSLAHGRQSGLRFALGVCAGSVFWGLVAAIGLGAFLATVGWALAALKVAGGLYLLWMALRTARAALAPAPAVSAPPSRRLFAQGLGLHLTNPKAVLSWSAVIALGLPSDAGTSYIAVFLAGCAVLALVVNLGYALVLSTAPLVRAFVAARRAFQAVFAGLFAGAGIALLAWRP